MFGASSCSAGAAAGHATPGAMALEAAVRQLLELDGAATRVFAASLGTAMAGGSRAVVGAAVAAAWREAPPPQAPSEGLDAMSQRMMAVETALRAEEQLPAKPHPGGDTGAPPAAGRGR